jgi:hypothetical protein
VRSQPYSAVQILHCFFSQGGRRSDRVRLLGALRLEARPPSPATRSLRIPPQTASSCWISHSLRR